MPYKVVIVNALLLDRDGIVVLNFLKVRRQNLDYLTTISENKIVVVSLKAIFV